MPKPAAEWGGRLAVLVSSADRTPQGTLGIELFLFCSSVPQPLGQRQESATVLACTGGAPNLGVREVLAAVVKLVCLSSHLGLYGVCRGGCVRIWGLTL